MDRKIDLTLNRDFRDRRKSISVPRSIFKRKNETQVSGVIYNQTNILSMNDATMTNSSWYVTGTSYSTNSTTNIISPTFNFNDKVCSRCGEDITRLPWQKERYGYLCRKCSKHKSNHDTNRIPWK